MRSRQDEVESAFTGEVRKARVNLGMSQEELADLMAGHGHGWHQTTVGKTESGERRVLLSEAVSLAELVGVDLPAYWT